MHSHSRGQRAKGRQRDAHCPGSSSIGSITTATPEVIDAIDGITQTLIQNRAVITMAFLGFGVRAPLALVVAGFYALGAITGGSLFALLRRSFEASRPTRT